jgi:hypothetical protein
MHVPAAFGAIRPILDPQPGGVLHKLSVTDKAEVAFAAGLRLAIFVEHIRPASGAFQGFVHVFSGIISSAD